MAGIHYCYRRLLIYNTARLTERNGVLLQLSRKRHSLVFQMSSLQKRVTLQKPKWSHNTNKLLFYRLASTSITDSKELISDSKLKVSEVKSSVNQPSEESVRLNNDAVQLGEETVVAKSSDPNFIDESLLPPIPEVSDVAGSPVVDYIAMGLKEPTLQSLGLGSWWPSGCLQQALEFLHINFDLPWWQAIVIVTIVFRSLLFPLNVKTRRESTIMMNCHMPKIHKLNEKISEAKLRGDYYSVALHSQELQQYMQKNKVGPLNFLKFPLIQGPIFISMYYALSGMANAPVESMKEGGLFWFQDLTVPDPYYILPVCLASTLYLVFLTGAEGSPAMVSMEKMRWFFRGIPVFIFFISLKFSACLTWYWAVSNTISLIQVGLLNVPSVKKFFNIQEVDPVASEILKKQRKSFVEGFKEGMETAKITRQIQDRERLNQLAFEKAGSGPVPRTFKKNPVVENIKKSSQNS